MLGVLVVLLAKMRRFARKNQVKLNFLSIKNRYFGRRNEKWQKKRVISVGCLGSVVGQNEEV